MRHVSVATPRPPAAHANTVAPYSWLVPRPALILARLQALTLGGLALWLTVRAISGHGVHSRGVLLAVAGFAVAGAVVLGVFPTRRHVRAPVIVLELIAVLVATQLVGVHRPGYAALVGAPALAVVALMFVGNAGDSAGGD